MNPILRTNLTSVFDEEISRPSEKQELLKFHLQINFYVLRASLRRPSNLQKMYSLVKSIREKHKMKQKLFGRNAWLLST